LPLFIKKSSTLLPNKSHNIQHNTFPRNQRIDPIDTLLNHTFNHLSVFNPPNKNRENTPENILLINLIRTPANNSLISNVRKHSR